MDGESFAEYLQRVNDEKAPDQTIQASKEALHASVDVLVGEVEKPTLIIVKE